MRPRVQKRPAQFHRSHLRAAVFLTAHRRTGLDWTGTDRTHRKWWRLLHAGQGTGHCVSCEYVPPL